jgi:tRNA (guanine-N7-)-methyltransferase
MIEQKKRIQSFARRRMTFGMSQKQRELIVDFLPTISISPDNCLDKIKNEAEIHFEIGFGNGEHLYGMAEQSPKALFIGCEPFVKGVSQALGVIEAQGLDNVLIYMEDARELLDAMPNASIDYLYVLFPDPWPKARHHKRRIINQEFLQLAHAKLKPTGALVAASDHEDYAEWILDHVAQSGLYAVKSINKVDWQQQPADWVPTKYEAKAKSLESNIYYYTFPKSHF